jgi:hypothetical protein
MARRPAAPTRPIRPATASPARGLTRALKNARFLQRVAPGEFRKAPDARGFGTGVPIDILRQLHRLQPTSPLLTRLPEVAAVLRQHQPPAPTRGGARDAMFSGTVYFAQVTFNTSGGALVVPTADMDTIIQYAQHAIVPIVEYVNAQYGPSTVSIAPTPLTLSVNTPNGTFTQSDLDGWVNQMQTNNGLSSNSAIYVVCPTGISSNEVGGNAGYHNIANIPFIVAGVYATGLTLQDEADVYAMVISHEMAEMIVDPKVDGNNPEVCDPCDINCNNLTRVYFDSADNYLGVNQNSPPSGFTYDYYICAIVKAEGAANCPASAADCQYAPIARSIEFVMGQSTFSKDEVDLTPSFAPAFWIQVAGFTSEALNLTTTADLSNTPNPPVTFQVSVDAGLNAPNGLSGAQLATINANLPTVAFGPAPIQPADPTFQQDPQVFLYPYTVKFASDAALATLNPDQAAFITITATLVVGQATVSVSAVFTLTSGQDPRFEDLNPAAPESYPSWLSFDLRFFKMSVPSSGGTTSVSRFGATMTRNASDAPGFIAQVIGNFTSGKGTAGGEHYDTALSQDEDPSALEFLQQDSSGNFVFNFALARVRLVGKTPGAVAKKVRVFFRLFQAQSTVSNFDTATTYRFSSDGQLNGVTVPLLGVQNGEYVTVPCFATPRVNVNPATNAYVPVSMATQPEDTPNAKNIDVTPNAEVDTFFGCWLDVNQPQQAFLPSTPPGGNPDGPFSGGLQSLNAVISNAAHQCLIAEIRYDDTPVPPGATTGDSDKLAQRNIAWIDGPNPGGAESRAMPHPFEIRATPASAPQPDELLVFWGNTPPGSTASFFLPALNAAHIIEAADALYPLHQLTSSGAHTIECPTGGVTFIPIPSGTARAAGLLTVDLPAGITKGDRYDIVVRQVTSASMTAPPPPPPIKRGTAAAAAAGDGVTYTWRTVLGTFQVSIVISTKEQLLLPEERLLAWLRWKLEVVPSHVRWYPVLKRYEQVVAGRVHGFGGNPGTILPSPLGNVPGHVHPPGPGPSHAAEECYTGKVVGIIHDRFGDFTGFLLLTEEGHEHHFKGHEPAVRELIERAWEDRALITVCVKKHVPEWPASIILRRLPHSLS